MTTRLRLGGRETRWWCELYREKRAFSAQVPPEFGVDKGKINGALGASERNAAATDVVEAVARTTSIGVRRWKRYENHLPAIVASISLLQRLFLIRLSTVTTFDEPSERKNNKIKLKKKKINITIKTKRDHGTRWRIRRRRIRENRGGGGDDGSSGGGDGRRRDVIFRLEKKSTRRARSRSRCACVCVYVPSSCVRAVATRAGRSGMLRRGAGEGASGRAREYRPHCGETACARARPLSASGGARACAKYVRGGVCLILRYNTILVQKSATRIRVCARPRGGKIKNNKRVKKHWR